MKLVYKNFEHRTKILDPFCRDPGCCGYLKSTRAVSMGTIWHLYICSISVK